MASYRVLPLSIASYMCPQTTAYVSSYYHTECLLILQHTCVLIRIRCAPAIDRTQPFPERESKRALEGAGGLRCHMPVLCVLKKIMQKKNNASSYSSRETRGRREASWTHILTLLFVCVLRPLRKRLPSLYYYVSYAPQVCFRYRSPRGHTTTPPCRLWCAKNKKGAKSPQVLLPRPNCSNCHLKSTCCTCCTCSYLPLEEQFVFFVVLTAT